MVVDDVEDHEQARRVGGVDEAGEALRAAVARLRRRDVDAVVAPPPASGELADGHELDRRDAELAQLGEVLDRRVEGPLLRERADVELVEDEVLEAHVRPRRGPREGPRVEHPRGPADPAGLPARARVGQRHAVEDDLVVVAVGGRQDGRADPEALLGERVVLPAQPQPHVLRPGRPDPELDEAVLDRRRAERTLPRVGAGRHASGISQRTPSGGRLSCTLWGWPCQGTASASTPP